VLEACQEKKDFKEILDLLVGLVSQVLLE